MNRLSIFDYVGKTETELTVGTKVINSSMEVGTITEINNNWIKILTGNVISLVSKRNFKYFYKVADNG